MTAIKFCGLTRAADAEFAEQHGASFLGVILASGPRLLTVEQAYGVLGPRRHTIKRAAVFGAQSVAEVASIGETLDLDVLQLHGDPTLEQIRQLRDRTERAVWPVLRVEGTRLPAEVLAIARIAHAIVLDAKVVGQLGGTGVRLDWAALVSEVSALRDGAPEVQLVLAGGLRAENVEEAIALLSPDVVDVSSGVEVAPGVKDPMAIERFVSAVSAAKGKKQ